MSKKNILIEPDPILRKKSQSLEKVDDELRKLMDDMLETMYAAPGIGLAAVQIGILKRLIVIDISKDDQKKKPLFLLQSKDLFKVIGWTLCRQDLSTSYQKKILKKMKV